MPSVPLIVTDAGIAEVINAEASGTAPVKLTEVGLGSGQYTAATGQTALVNEVKRLDTTSGGGIGDNIIHVSVTDESSDTYTVHEIGVFTESGTLFAVYAQSQPIIQKASASWMMLSLDIALVGIPEASVTFGDTNFVLPSATTETQGIVELATDVEVQTGTDTSRAVTPKGLASRTATESRSGIAEISTQTEVEAGTDDSRIVSPKKLKALLDGRTATEDKTGLVELATNEEVQTGTDTGKAVTPAGLASRTATETRTGLVELATTAEVQAGTDTSRAVTPKGLASRTATESRSGIAEITTQTEVDAGTDDSRIVSPKKLKAAFDGRSATETPKVSGTGAVGSSTKYAREDHVHPAQASVTGSSGSCTGNAATATELKNARTIDGVSFDGSAAITHYGTCSTDADTAAKVVALSGFALVTGARITVRFTVTNTAASPTLNVNSTGAKAIRYRNSAISAGYLEANRTYDFAYDGSCWQLVGDINTDTKYTAATATPKVAGTGAVGSSTRYAREDHVHPAQASVTGSSGSCTGNAATATELKNARTIDGISFDGSAAITHYGTCSTAASTAAKVVALSGFALVTGARITVRFTVTNTASNPTLNVNSTGAKAIRYRNSAISAGYLAANRTYEFVYDGSYWQLVGDIDTDSKLSIATQVEAEAGTNNTKAMSPLRVKQAIDIFAMPVGSIYVQFSGQSTPSDLFGGTWSNISSNYAGRFFRAEGGNAAAFGSSQDGGLPNIVGELGIGASSGSFYPLIADTPGGALGYMQADGTVSLPSTSTRTGHYGGGMRLDAGAYNGIYGSAQEVRPINSTIRIWKRTA